MDGDCISIITLALIVSFCFHFLFQPPPLRRPFIDAHTYLLCIHSLSSQDSQDRQRERVFILVNNHWILFFVICNSIGCVRASVFSGAAAAAKIYLESLSRVAKQAQQGTCGGTADIGKKTKSFTFLIHKIFDSLIIFRCLRWNGFCARHSLVLSLIAVIAQA